ncbi:tyrosine-protein phosphatase [Flavobacterium sp.]|uniref:tyrosine-protein phosphatase n=1 Tax=Flavobacterium sp. TaxID=239 RepID=UPI00352869A6
MFSIFKSKPILASLLPNNYVDIHSHVLPGIDDGAKDINDTEFLLTEMTKLGFSKVIATPHTIKTVWNNTTKTITAAKELTHDKLNNLSEKLRLNAASEYMMDDSFLSLLKNEKLLTLKDNYVLVEMSYLNPPIQLFDILFELQVEGYIPVLAHPERYNFYHTDFKQYEKLKKAGCLFQMNLLSSTGYYGKGVLATADKLLANHMIDYVGSDIHHKNHIQAFQNKVQLKSIATFTETMLNNSFFS